MVLVTAVKIAIVACTFVGNLFVIIAILVDKNLQTPANQLVLSLAFADLMVGCLVMPLGTYNDFHQGWWLGKEVCEFWTSADVLCCTASILNLLAIALDRYWAVTNVDYIYKRTRKRVSLMILCAWTVGAIVSLAPIFGWKDPDFARRVLEDHMCLVSQDVAYQIFATVSTFYAPLVLLLALYWRIFKVARKRIHCKPGGRLGAVAHSQSASRPTRPLATTTSNLVSVNNEQKSQPLALELPASLSAAALAGAAKSAARQHAANNGPQAARATEAPQPSRSSVQQARRRHNSIAQRAVPAREAARADCQREAKNVSLREQAASNLKPLAGADGAPGGSSALTDFRSLAASSATANKDNSRDDCARPTTLTANELFTGVARQPTASNEDAQRRANQASSNAAAAADTEATRSSAAQSWSLAREKRSLEAVVVNEKQICLRPERQRSADQELVGHNPSAEDNQRLAFCDSVREKQGPPSKGLASGSNQVSADQSSSGPIATAGAAAPAMSKKAALALRGPAPDRQASQPGDVLRLLRCLPRAPEQRSSKFFAKPQAASSDDNLARDWPHQLDRPAADRRLGRRPSLVQLDAQMLTNCQANNCADNNIDESSEANSLSECHCCCCLHTLDGHTSDEDEDGVAARLADECDDDDGRRDQHREQAVRGDNQAGSFRKRPWPPSPVSSAAAGAGPACGDKILLHHQKCLQPQTRSQEPLAASGDFREGRARLKQHARAVGGVLSSLSHSDSAATLVSSASSSSSSSSSSSRSMLAAAAAAELECLDGQLIEQLQSGEPPLSSDFGCSWPARSSPQPPGATGPTGRPSRLDAPPTITGQSGGRKDNAQATLVCDGERAELANQSSAKKVPPTMKARRPPDRAMNATDRGDQQPAARGDHLGDIEAQLRQPEPISQQQHSKRFSSEAADRTLTPDAVSRASGIRRRFRALGQLVSFVQTSRQFTSSSSAHTSQSGDEEDEDEEEPDEETGSRHSQQAERAQIPQTTTTETLMTATLSMEQMSIKTAATGQGDKSSIMSADQEPLTADGDRPTGKRDSNLNGLLAATTNKLAVSATGPFEMGGPASGALANRLTPPKPPGQRPRELYTAQQRRQNLEMKREKKAAKTLAIITGVFVCCWLPFFLNAIVMPICGPACTPSELILSVLLWLGYLNSLLNPIIYTIFSPDFRRAFRRLLCWPEPSKSSRLSPKSKGRELSSGYGRRKRHAVTASARPSAVATNQRALDRFA